MDVAPGPWPLTGECVVGMARAGGVRPDLPAGLRPLPGPRLVIASRFDQSPVGPYLELCVAEPARLASRAGMCVTTIVVSTAEARLGGRVNWGLPKELGSLIWSEEGDTRVLRWAERNVEVRATPVGPPLPALVPFRTLQRRADGPVSALARLRGLARPARVEVSVPAADPLAWLDGRHLGTVVASARLVMGEACVPRDVRAARRAPRQAPEPALSWAPNPGD